MTAASNRAAMPTVARIVDEARAAFGADVRVVYASELGITKGEPTPPGVKISDEQIAAMIAQRRADRELNGYTARRNRR